MDNPNLEAIVIGGGVCGLLVLKEAVRCNLECILLEGKSDVGGLWRDAPDWQDIQSRKEEWGVENFMAHSEKRADIYKSLKTLALPLTQKIVLNSPVNKVESSDGLWHVHTPNLTFTARSLIVATGAHNRPKTPAISGPLPKIHSFDLKNPTLLQGKRICVVGSGASALDLLDLCFQNNAKEVNWIYRHSQWFIPTRGPKYYKTDIRAMAKGQSLAFGNTNQAVSRRLTGALSQKYKNYGMEDILPSTRLDLNTYGLIPGRSEMLKNYSHIRKFTGEIASTDDSSVTMKSGQRIEADLILLGTGFDMDLEYLQLPQLAQIHSPEALCSRAFYYFKSIDYENLYFAGIPVLNTIGSTPIAAALFARTIVSTIKNRTPVPREVFLFKSHHYDLIKVFAKFDRKNYPKFSWRYKMLKNALYYHRNPNEVWSGKFLWND